MTKTFCDRCGGEFPSHELTNIHDADRHHFGVAVRVPSVSWDLCGRCLEVLKKWMEANK